MSGAACDVVRTGREAHCGRCRPSEGLFTWVLLSIRWAPVGTSFDAYGSPSRRPLTSLIRARTAYSPAFAGNTHRSPTVASSLAVAAVSACSPNLRPLSPFLSSSRQFRCRDVRFPCSRRMQRMIHHLESRCRTLESERTTQYSQTGCLRLRDSSRAFGSQGRDRIGILGAETESFSGCIVVRKSDVGCRPRLGMDSQCKRI